MSEKIIYVAMWTYEMRDLLQHLEVNPGNNEEVIKRLRTLLEEVPNA